MKAANLAIASRMHLEQHSTTPGLIVSVVVGDGEAETRDRSQHRAFQINFLLDP